MNNIIPLLIVFAIVSQVAAFARVAYLRRVHMLERVVQYQKRTDATVRMKFLACSAFHDTLSVKLPWDMVGISIEMQKGGMIHECTDGEMKRLVEQCAPSAIELQEIIRQMIALNRKFNGVMHFASFCRKVAFNIESKAASNCVDEIFINLDRLHANQ
ncbi:hypothetical protein [Serratia marcescens]|uniref:hypothetical protein n=1 Tax=Serratia marcescens TaxID=615 RepID=UPI001BAF772F|nr:hypothetical protein [Serratia marcescens]MBS3895077.1 hypothetical protein [Serratia marcescens]